MSASRPAVKSKTLATWIALLGGSVGLHRFYLHGVRDLQGWVYPVPTLLGLYGIYRARHFGLDDHLSWLLIPLLGLMLAASMLSAIVYGLTPDPRWNAQFNPQHGERPSSWLAVLGVILALAFGGAALVASIAFSGQRYFEYQAESAGSAMR